ncbi:MAG: hypothetical protein EA363_00510, partial [Balneolaceae bacterium]
MRTFQGKNREIMLFILKALGVYVVWYALYHLWLLPDGRLDEYISRNIVSVTATLLQVIGYEVFAFDRIVGIARANGLEIIDGCNGIETIGLFIGFVLAYPGNTIKRWLFIPTGILIIYLVNVARIFVLAIIQYHWYSGFQMIHDYTFNLIFYLVVFAMWVVWALKGNGSAKGADTAGTDAETDTVAAAGVDTETAAGSDS